MVSSFSLSILFPFRGNEVNVHHLLNAKTVNKPIRPKEKICVFPVTSPKNRVGRSLLLFFFIIFFIFPDFTKKHNKCVVCMKYIMKRGLFGAINLQYRMDVLL